MSRDLGLADRLRAFGVPVDEYPGWQARGDSTLSQAAPFAAVTHHTAGGASGIAPSLGILVNGRSGIPGPLCNVFQDRRPDGNDHAVVIAAGKSNNAGSGGWRGLSGNSRTRGLEIEHPGLSALPEARLNRAAQIQAAVLWGSPAADAIWCCQHWEWAPQRKIDVSTDPIRGGKLDGDAFRARVAGWLAWKAGAHPIPPAPPAPRRMEPLLFILGILDPDTKHSWYVLLGPGVMANIDQPTAARYQSWGIKIDNGPYHPLFAIARAKELGAWNFPPAEPAAIEPPAQG